MEGQPLVSICCITYNHVDYIRDCLDGFLMQQCDFKFEILIHDDCSTDGATEIIQEYQKKHPDIVKPIFQKENQWSKGVRGISSKYNFPRAKGKYIAMCEGDDYWTDPLKLQKQVDFLENNADYSFVCGGFVSRDILNKKDEIIIKQKVKCSIDNDKGFEITFSRMKKDWITKTLTLVFRRDCLNLNVLSNYKYQRDVHLVYHLLKVGNGYYFKEVFGLYNIHSGGVFSLKSHTNKLISHYYLYKELYSINKDEYSRAKYLGIISQIFISKDPELFNEYNLKRSLLLKEALPLLRNWKELKFLIKFLIS